MNDKFTRLGLLGQNSLDELFTPGYTIDNHLKKLNNDEMLILSVNLLHPAFEGKLIKKGKRMIKSCKVEDNGRHSCSYVTVDSPSLSKGTGVRSRVVKSSNNDDRKGNSIHIINYV